MCLTALKSAQTSLPKLREVLGQKLPDDLKKLENQLQILHDKVNALSLSERKAFLEFVDDMNLSDKKSGFLQEYAKLRAQIVRSIRKDNPAFIDQEATS